MTEEKKVTAKKPAKKVAAKKAEPKNEVVEDVVEESSQPVRKKRAEIARNELIPCRSTVTGELIYISDRTGAKFIWEDFGSTLWIEMGDLQDMNGSKRVYLHDGYIVVDDEQASENLGLTKVYEKIAHIHNVKDVFDQTVDELAETLPKLPKGLQDSLSTKARAMVEDGSLDSLNKIRVIGECLGIDLEDFAKK